MPEILLPPSHQSFFFLHLPAVSAFSCSICHFSYVTAIINSSIRFPPLCAHLSPLPGHVCPSLADFLFVSPILASKPTPNTSACTLLTQVFFLHQCVTLSSRRRPADLLWHPRWRRPRRQPRLGWGKRDGEGGLWGRRLHSTQNHGRRLWHFSCCTHVTTGSNSYNLNICKVKNIKTIV